MAYTLLAMMKGYWLEGNVFRGITYRNTFIKDLAFLLDELHQYPYSEEYESSNMFSIVRNLVLNGDKYIKKFTEETISEFREIESELTGKVLLHGDLHGKNIIVNSNNNFQGIIDWENMCIGDPHWEFRKIRCYIGWQGLEKLLSYYNGNCNLEYIKILDKVALCHSLQLRQNPDLYPKNNDSPDIAGTYEKYIRKWPENIYW